MMGIDRLKSEEYRKGKALPMRRSCVTPTTTYSSNLMFSYAEKLEQKIATLQQKIHALSGSDDIDRLLDQYQQQPKKRVDHDDDDGNHDDEKSRPAKLSDSFVEELDALHSRQYPPGVRYDSVKYLGDLDNFLFFSNKLRLHDNNKGLKWKGHYLRRVGNDIGKGEKDMYKGERRVSYILLCVSAC